MTEEQIKEARERLNISVEGESSSSVPLEAFDDMVRCKFYSSFITSKQHQQQFGLAAEPA